MAFCFFIGKGNEIAEMKRPKDCFIHGVIVSAFFIKRSSKALTITIICIQHLKTLIKPI